MPTGLVSSDHALGHRSAALRLRGVMQPTQLDDTTPLVDVERIVPAGDWTHHLLGGVLQALDGLADWIESPSEEAARGTWLQKARRTAHDIKGLSGMAGLERMYLLAERAELCLDGMVGRAPGAAGAQAQGELLRTLAVLRQEAVAAHRRMRGSICCEETPRGRVETATDIGVLWRRAERLAHRVAERLGKCVRVIRHNDEVQVRTQLLAALVGPIGHVVRNAVYHGIEAPEDRQAAGKSAAGELSLAARRSGAGLVMVIGDDGRGMDWDALEGSNARASTAGQVCDLAGRGLGLDAVRQAMRKLGGVVTVASSPGRYTRVILRIPLGSTGECNS